MKARMQDGVVYSPFPSADIPSCSAYTVIEEALSRNPERVAFIQGSIKTTRAELLALMKCYAVGFQQQGIGPGDRVCAHLKNSLENLAAMYGCIFAGATLVLAKTSLTERELRGQIVDSDSTHVLTDVELAEKVTKAILYLDLKGLLAMGPVSGFTDAASFKYLDQSFFRECPVGDPREAVFVVVYTSGTTGLPKGVELTHHSFVANFCISKPCMSSDETDTMLASAPIGHLSGLVLGLMAVLDGSVCVLAQPGLSLQEITELADEHNITSMFSFPTRLQTLAEEMLRDGKADQEAFVASAWPVVYFHKHGQLAMGPVSGFVDAASFKHLDQSAFRECPVGDPREAVFVVVYTSGTMGLPKGVELTHHSFVANFCISKHLTETIGNSYKATKMAIGYFLVEVKSETPYEKFTDLVVDPVSRVKLGPNEPGEICFRIPTVMRGYYKRPKETAEFFEGNGWCRSGD
nr:probable 4-coumarate--CoA ligase 3 [Rhipicephalus microplus]